MMSVSRLLFPLALLAAAQATAAPADHRPACTTPVIADDARLSDAGMVVYTDSLRSDDQAMARLKKQGWSLRTRIEKAVYAPSPDLRALDRLHAEETQWNIARAEALSRSSAEVIKALSPRDKAIYARMWRMSADPRPAASPLAQANRAEAEIIRRQIVSLTRCPVEDAELGALLGKELALEVAFQKLQLSETAGHPELVRTAWLAKLQPAQAEVQLASATTGGTN